MTKRIKIKNQINLYAILKLYFYHHNKMINDNNQKHFKFRVPH